MLNRIAATSSRNAGNDALRVRFRTCDGFGTQHDQGARCRGPLEWLPWSGLSGCGRGAPPGADHGEAEAGEHEQQRGARQNQREHLVDVAHDRALGTDDLDRGRWVVLREARHAGVRPDVVADDRSGGGSLGRGVAAAPDCAASLRNVDGSDSAAADAGTAMHDAATRMATTRRLRMNVMRAVPSWWAGSADWTRGSLLPGGRAAVARPVNAGKGALAALVHPA